MGTGWSKGSELGVVLVTLGLALACGGKYDVGAGDTGGGAGGSGASDPGSGGSSVGGRGGAVEGGATMTGGRGGDTSGGTAGASAGGASAGGASAGGSSTGGAVGECEMPGYVLPEYTPAPPDVVWDRLSHFLYDETRAPLDPLPEVTTVEWVRDRVRAILAEQYGEDERAPAGLEYFIRYWMFGTISNSHPDEQASVEFWASNFARLDGNFADFFAPVGDRVSFMSDRVFLTLRENSTRRAMWMTEELLCTPIGPPPPNVVIAPVTVPPTKTRRETIEETVSQDSCIGCHSYMDPLGFSLEHYDSVGDYRTTENGLPIDSSGTYSGTGDPIVFNSIDDLAPQFVTRCEVQSCFMSFLFQHALTLGYRGAPPLPDGADLAYVMSEFRAHDLALGSLLEAIATTPTFLRE